METRKEQERWERAREIKIDKDGDKERAREIKMETSKEQER